MWFQAWFKFYLGLQFQKQIANLIQIIDMDSFLSNFPMHRIHHHSYNLHKDSNKFKVPFPL